jgi:hypothetical protein
MNIPRASSIDYQIIKVEKENIRVMIDIILVLKLF